MIAHHSKKFSCVLGVIVTVFLGYVGMANAAQDKGGYADLDLGVSTIDVSPGTVGADSGDESNSTNFAWRADVGYQFNPNFAVELGYTDWGQADLKNLNDVSGANGNVTQRSADFLGKLIFPLNSAFDLFVKGGASYVKSEADVNSLAKTLNLSSDSNTALRPLFGLGASYEFYPRATANIAWLYLPGGSGIKTSNFYGLGLGYLFG
jgi:OOP family OmpA-OmpF porin